MTAKHSSTSSQGLPGSQKRGKLKCTHLNWNDPLLIVCSSIMTGKRLFSPWKTACQENPLVHLLDCWFLFEFLPSFISSLLAQSGEEMVERGSGFMICVNAGQYPWHPGCVWGQAADIIQCSPCNPDFSTDTLQNEFSAHIYIISIILISS